MEEKITKKIFTVSEITLNIKNYLEKNFFSFYIKGEISNFKVHSSGHIYFSLKDSFSQVSCVFFRRYASILKRPLKDGDQIIAYGDMTVYPVRGNYQIIVKEIKVLGLGDLLLKLQKLKEELKNLGYFEKKYKKPLPLLPKTIGVITSPTGAVIKDILNVLKRRYFNFHLILNPVKVQGEKAAKEIALAIEDFNKYQMADVIILARGGGSFEDLFPFNEKIVAHAIFKSKIPIISAVGHETDNSISDFVADKRAPTPSAAAEIVVLEKENLLYRISNYSDQIKNVIQNNINNKKKFLQNIIKQNFFSFSILSKYFQKLDEITNFTDIFIKNFISSKKQNFLSLKKQIEISNPKSKIIIFKNKFLSFSQKIDIILLNKINFLKKEFQKFSKLELYILPLIKYKKEALKRIKSQIESIHPKNLLKKGYSILFSEKTDSIIISTKDVQKDQKIYVRLYDGKIKAKVEKIYE